MNLSARKVRDEQVKRWIADFGKEEPGDHRALKGVLTIFASVLEENLRTPGARKKVAYAFIHCARAINLNYFLLHFHWLTYFELMEKGWLPDY